MCRRYFPTFWVSECRLSDILVWWLFALFFSSSFKHLSTDTVLFNWFTIANLDLIPLFIWPRIILLTFPISVLVWFMSLHFRYLGIFSLWSLKFGRSAFSVAYIELICYFVVFFFLFFLPSTTFVSAGLMSGLWFRLTSLNLADSRRVCTKCDLVGLLS